ncbi:hypothetical protein [Rhizobium gallicum]|uniref:hypothetical protein n=1 Tax=Rhizobium gallicum TaxID=56730 RepID=UPI000589CF59|nr:hypothetical protein [Rhizobium gallicum]
MTIYSDGEKNVCGFLDGSPVLVPTGVGKEDDRRRFRFSEGERELRSKGDIFCADMGTAGFVRQAINEKLVFTDRGLIESGGRLSLIPRKWRHWLCRAP